MSEAVVQNYFVAKIVRVVLSALASRLFQSLYLKPANEKVRRKANLESVST